MNTPLAVWIGWDSREAIAADVCLFSLLKYSTIPLHVRMLKQSDVCERGIYYRTWTDKNGQKFDTLDGRPFSTEFSFARFLVPALMDYAGWALFCDCDFLFRADVAELMPLMETNADKPLLVCKQTHEPSEATKMDGVAQTRYRRKNWSSFMLINCQHPETKTLSVAAVNSKPGWWLHGFDWTNNIGEIPPQWNWISGVTEGEAKAVHYTAGGPWFPQCTEVAYAKEWREAYAAACKEARKEAA